MKNGKVISPKRSPKKKSPINTQKKMMSPVSSPIYSE